jgi:DNA (cytosine-5)-methyltransferase 1
MAIDLKHRQKLAEQLDALLVRAESSGQPVVTQSLPMDILHAVDSFSQHVDSNATSALTNIITCLLVNAVFSNCDPRYHRAPRNGMPAPPKGKTHFSGRVISESVVYPWLRQNGFRGAKSGWQTRVFERPLPYLLNYPENIARVKAEFLNILDAAATGRVSAADVLVEFFRLELALKSQRQSVAQQSMLHHNSPGVSIRDIVSSLGSHFALPNASRLPVIALYSIYHSLLTEFSRYAGLRLRPLEEHSAADLHTGALGDIEVESVASSDVVEVVEVKHGVTIDDEMIRTACDKIVRSGGSVKRYYILSTMDKTNVSATGWEMIEEMRETRGCEIVVNGVLPTLKYYLRLLEHSTAFCACYERTLAEACIYTQRVTVSQLEAWSEMRHRGFKD